MSEFIHFNKEWFVFVEGPKKKAIMLKFCQTPDGFGTREIFWFHTGMRTVKSFVKFVDRYRAGKATQKELALIEHWKTRDWKYTRWRDRNICQAFLTFISYTEGWHYP